MDEMEFVKVTDSNGNFKTWRIKKTTDVELEKHKIVINDYQMIVMFCNYFQLPMTDMMNLLNWNNENMDEVENV